MPDDKVYFGKLQVLSDGSYMLMDIYYPQSAQQNIATNSSGDQVTSAAPSVQLIKFGTEVLGAQDRIVFTKQQVSHWVNLKSDSKVIKAIQACIKK